MNLEARKILFVQEFLKLQNEEIIGGLEKFLRKQKAELLENDLRPMSMEQLNKEIDQSLNDVEDGLVMEAKTLKNKVGEWK
ncbi:hypothetical protein [Mucilaginibacter arboris]|uniref:Uncharacterized protein n=1 Tax=Mucilaginibacter arboris TaxID=2682090 RepID=A0A7K1SSJ0_9SPHI|nr:hypothetical protein [Mucilaginibacter arboris]MVN20271.1 hypothetical protein [Mucilaginibacter arboris]